MELAGERPDVVVGCVGGGSNYAGLAYPFIVDRLSGATPEMRFLATEPAACPTLTKGRFAYDFGDTGEMMPLLPMYTLGHTFVPAPVHAGGLRYHGDAPSLSSLVKHGHMEAAAFSQNAVFDAAVQFAHTEGIVPAPESAHAVRGAIDEAIAAREAGEERVILLGLSGSRCVRHAGLRRLPQRAPARGRVPPGGCRGGDGERPRRGDPWGTERSLDLGLERPRREAELLGRQLGDLSRDDACSRAR